MRYYREKDQIVGKCIYATIPHRYEYNGSVKYLVMTDMSNRAFFSIISAYINPKPVVLYGPPGSGKTETVKDLAKKLGINCIRYNCNENVEIEISKIFKFIEATGF